MKKDYILCLGISSVIMLLFPLLAVTLIPADAGMAVCFLLFFAVNPIYALLTGTYAGKNARSRWGLPVIPAFLFLTGTWIFFDMHETAFILYAGIYLLLGMTAMLISMLFNKRSRRSHGL